VHAPVGECLDLNAECYEYDTKPSFSTCCVAVCGRWLVNLAGAGTASLGSSKLGREADEKVLSGIFFLDSFRVGCLGARFGFDALFFNVGTDVRGLAGKGTSAMRIPCRSA
jgi:hypothetical protein